MEIDPWAPHGPRYDGNRINFNRNRNRNGPKLSNEKGLSIPLFQSNNIELIPPLFLQNHNPIYHDSGSINYQIDKGYHSEHSPSRHNYHRRIRPKPFNHAFLSDEDKKLIEFHFRNLKQSNHKNDKLKSKLPKHNRKTKEYKNEFLHRNKNGNVNDMMNDDIRPPVYKSLRGKSHHTTNGNKMMFNDDEEEPKQKVYHKDKKLYDQSHKHLKFWNNNYPKSNLYDDQYKKRRKYLSHYDMFKNRPEYSSKSSNENRNHYKENNDMHFPLKPLENNYPLDGIDKKQAYNSLNSNHFNGKNSDEISNSNEFLRDDYEHNNNQIRYKHRNEVGVSTPSYVRDNKLEMENFDKEREEFMNNIKQHFNKERINFDEIKNLTGNDNENRNNNSNSYGNQTNGEKYETISNSEPQEPQEPHQPHQYEQSNEHEQSNEDEHSIHEDEQSNEDEHSNNEDINNNINNNNNKESEIGEDKETRKQYNNNQIETLNDEEEKFDDMKETSPSWPSSIPGEPGKDYPTFSVAKQSQFSCKGKKSGYYADVTQKCQV